MRSMLASIAAGALISACGGEGGADRPGEKAIAPPESAKSHQGSIHLAVEGVTDTWVETGASGAHLEYNFTGRPSAALMIGSPHAGLSIGWRPQSASESLDEHEVRVAFVGLGPLDTYPLAPFHAEVSPAGVHVEGTVSINGALHAVLVDGPVYRQCVRPSGSPGKALDDPDFGGACAAFK